MALFSAPEISPTKGGNSGNSRNSLIFCGLPAFPPELRGGNRWEQMAVNLAHDVPTSFIGGEQISSGGNGMDMRRATGTMPSWPAKEVTELGRKEKGRFGRRNGQQPTLRWVRASVKSDPNATCATNRPSLNDHSRSGSIQNMKSGLIPLLCCATLMIGAATALVTASSHAFVQVSKELCEWWKGDRRRTRLLGPLCQD